MLSQSALFGKMAKRSSDKRQHDADVLSVKLLPQAITPKARPNLAILMIDRAVLLTTTVRDLCGRLHAAHLVPLECPIIVVEVSSGSSGRSWWRRACWERC